MDHAVFPVNIAESDDILVWTVPVSLSRRITGVYAASEDVHDAYFVRHAVLLLLLL